MKVIPNGIETERFLGCGVRDLRAELNLPEDSFLIGFLGRFMPAKGFSYLVDAVEHLRGNGGLPFKPLVLALGWGAFIREEQRDIHRRGLDEFFLFLPYTPDVGPTLKGLDVVAVPSVWEAFGLIAAEALTAGVPVIGTSCIGLREVLRGTPARMVPPADGPALARAIGEEMLHPTKAESWAFQNEAVERFNVEKRVRELETVLQELIQR